MARITLYRVKSEDPLELEPLQRWEGLGPEEAEARFIEMIERLEMEGYECHDYAADTRQFCIRIAEEREDHVMLEKRLLVMEPEEADIKYMLRILGVPVGG